MKTIYLDFRLWKIQTIFNKTSLAKKWISFSSSNSALVANGSQNQLFYDWKRHSDFPFRKQSIKGLLTIAIPLGFPIFGASSNMVGIICKTPKFRMGPPCPPANSITAVVLIITLFKERVQNVMVCKQNTAHLIKSINKYSSLFFINKL